MSSVEITYWYKKLGHLITADAVLFAKSKNAVYVVFMKYLPFRAPRIAEFPSMKSFLAERDVLCSNMLQLKLIV